MTGFDETEFNQILSDIEKYLGYLRGNELAYEYMRNTEKDFSGGEGTMLFVEPFEEGYRYPCPEDRFKVKPIVPMHLYLGPGTKPRDFVKLVQQSMDESWQLGKAWSAGIADYARSVCDPFTRPKVGPLITAMENMQEDVVAKLAIGATVDWANLGSLNTRWTGEGAREFNNFYLNFGSVLRIFGIMSAYVNCGIAYSTGIIDGTQQGALRFVRDVRDGLVKQLEAWARAGRKPSDEGEIPAWVADVAQIAWDLFGMIPVAGELAEAKKLVNDVRTLTGAVKKAQTAGGQSLPPKQKPFKSHSADAIYKSLTETLYTDYFKAYDTALKGLHSGGVAKPDGTPPTPDELANRTFSGANVLELMDDVQKRHDWQLPEVGPGSLKGPGDRY